MEQRPATASYTQPKDKFGRPMILDEDAEKINFIDGITRVPRFTRNI